MAINQLVRQFAAKPTTCKRCGSDDVAWAQNKSGKYYLVQGGLVHPELKAQGLLIFSRFAFHKCVETSETD